MRCLFLVLCLACSAPAPSASSSTPSGPVQVAALSAPVGWLAERVGGDRVQVRQINPAGEDPPFWHPSGDLIASLGEADLIVANGAGFEAWTATAALPTSKLVDTSRGLDLITHDGPTHSHGKGGEHSHKGVDPHTWADPALFAQQAVAVRDALVRVDAAGAATYDAGLSALQADLVTLGQELDVAMAPLASRKVAANHPTFTYLARRVGQTIPSLHLDPEVAPDAETVARVTAALPGDGDVLLWEAEPTAEVMSALPASIRHVVLDPLEQPASHGTYDYAVQTRANVRALHPLAVP